MTGRARIPKSENAPKTNCPVVDFLEGYSIETTVAGATQISSFRDFLPPATAVYISSLRETEDQSVVDLAVRLTKEGMVPVPHLVARSFIDTDSLDMHLERLSGEAGVDRALLIAGDNSRSCGPFESSLAILETGFLDRIGFRKIGFAGHPEGHSTIDAAALWKALADKAAFAERSDAEFYIVSQFSFDAEPVIRWISRLRSSGNHMPIHVGIAGPANIRTLLGYARICGIGPSSRILSRRGAQFARLAFNYASDHLIEELSQYRISNPECGVVRVHLFPFGGLEKTTHWLGNIGV